MNKISILDMPEDLLDQNRSEQTSSPKKPTSDKWTGKAHSSKIPLNQDNFIADVAKLLDIAKEELHDWVQEAALPKNVLQAILRVAKRLKLNPLIGQIEWELNSEGDYEVYIPIDSWITLIHRENTFQGITFDQSSESENGIPSWIECSIYRSDLAHPITVREYYVELKTEHPIWQQMPRRMLRHKTLQQCARLAFGISLPYTLHNKPIESTKIPKTFHQKKGLVSTKQLLREKLFANPS